MKPSRTGARDRLLRFGTRIHSSALLRLFSTAVLDQVVLSGASFVVGLLLIRHAAHDDYGYYVLAQAAVILLSSAQSAWISGPVAVLAPKQTVEGRRLMISLVEQGQRRVLRWAVVVLLPMIPLATLLGLLSRTQMLVVVASLLAAWTAMHREYLRSVLFIYGRPKTVLGIDVSYAAVLVAVTVIAVTGLVAAAPVAVLGLAAAGATFAFLARRALARDPGWTDSSGPPPWAQLRRLGIWSMVGSIVYWLYGQGFNYVLAAKVDVGSVASVNAMRLLLMPTWVLTLGIKGLLTPSAAAWLHESGYAKLVARLSWFVAGVAVLFSVYFSAVWMTRDWLVNEFLHKQLDDRDKLILAWAGVSTINMVRDLYQSALFAREQFRPMAWLTAISAAASLLAMWLLIDRMGPVGTVVGLGIGETVSLLGVLILVAKGFGESSRPPPAAA